MHACVNEANKIIAALTLIIKAVDPVNAGTLVVPTQNKKILWVLDLVRQQQANGLERLLSAVYVVAKEKVVCLWGKAAILKESEQVVVLSVNVALKF